MVLSKIRYSGNPIGNDIRVDVEILGKSLRVDKRINIGATVEINREIGSLQTDQRLFPVEVAITVIEKDSLFNDVGRTSGGVKVNTNARRPQQFIFRVQVEEARSLRRRFRKKAVAVFAITIEALVTDVVRYVPNDDEGKGWLIVRIEKSKSEESLSAYVKVRPEYNDGKREYFTPLERTYRDTLVSAKLQNDGSSNLISGIWHKGIARASYSISKKIFTLNAKTYTTVDYKNAPWKKGFYDIEIPDYPHALGARYEKEAPRAKTWFRIGHSGERYLHAGGRSLGCVTVTAIRRWAEIYEALIRARKGDGMSVGVLEVTD